MFLLIKIGSDAKRGSPRAPHPAPVLWSAVVSELLLGFTAQRGHRLWASLPYRPIWDALTERTQHLTAHPILMLRAFLRAAGLVPWRP